MNFLQPITLKKGLSECKERGEIQIHYVEENISKPLRFQLRTSTT
jgi:hypothetical protein